MNNRSDLGASPVVDDDVVDAELLKTRTLPALRVVENTVIPRRLASTAVAFRPTDVPPRIRRLCPGCASRPTVREPWDVCSISGTAPIVVQSSALWIAITCATGTQVYSA